MRLFIAVLFPVDIEASLYQAVEKLKNKSKSGTFTARENLHLTVNFIGETKRLEEVTSAMQRAVDKANALSFELTVRGFGRFRRREGDIYWIGVEKENTLWRLQKELVKELKEAGFYDVDDMEYTPHLTLGRRVIVKEGFNSREFESEIAPMAVPVSRLSLMKSERLEGKLVYTEIFHIGLGREESK